MASSNLARRPAVLLAFGLCAFGGVVTLLGRLASGPAVEQKRVALTNEAGAQAYPAFSPDGREVAYSGQNEGSFHVYVRPASGGSPRELTQAGGNDIGPVWSPDGSTLAFLRVDEGRAAVVTIPSAGGPERKLTEFDVADDDDSIPSPSIAWTRDGESLIVSAGGEKQVPALSRLSIKSGEMRRLTNPPEGSQGDANPAVSPDGKTLAFVRKLDQDRGNVFICDLECKQPRAVTYEDHTMRGLAWSGQDLIFASDRGPGWRLWRVPAYGGSPRDILLAGTHASYPAVTARGAYLAFTDSPSNSAVWRAHLGTPDEPQEHLLIRSASAETNAAWSPDGTRIVNVSEQSGAPELWVGDANGRNRVQITRLDGPRIRNPRWSPDGATILFQTIGQNGSQIFTVPSGGGKLTHVLGDATDASWSRDGKHIFFAAGPNIWRTDADGSNRQQLSQRFGNGGPEESADGKWIYYRSRGTIWRIPVEGGKGEEAIVPEHGLLWAPLQITKAGIYYNEFDRGQRAIVVSFYDFSTGKSRPMLRIKDGDFNDGFSVSADGQWVLYPKTDRHQTSLALIENFR